MKLNDIINEEPISEIPVGIGSTIKTAVKSINPFSVSSRSTAQGSQISSKRANDLYSAYYKWIGERGIDTTAESVITFLKSIRAPAAAIKAAEKELVAPAPTTTQRTPPVKVEPTQEGVQGASLDKNIISKAFLSAARAYGVSSQSAPVAPRAANTSAPSASAAPAVTINDLYNHYRKLKTKDRETFRTNLDLIDQEPAPEEEPMNINEGFSRFLGISL